MKQTDTSPFANAVRMFFTDQGKHPEPDADLFMEGWIDSLGVLDLMSFLEEQHNIFIPQDRMSMETFRSINSLVKEIESQTTERKA